MVASTATSNPATGHLPSETIKPRPLKDFSQDVHRSESVGISWDETASRLHMEQECIETKVITTTTTTKRHYPSIQIRAPRSLGSLDGKEYPLARTPTPEELSKFSYMVGEQEVRNDRKVLKASTIVSILKSTFMALY